MQEGSLQNEMYLLLSGRLKVIMNHQNIVAETIKNVAIIGEIEALLNQPCCSTVRAEEPSTLLRISHEKLTALFSRETGVGLKIYRNLCKLRSEKVVCDNMRLQDICKHVDPAALHKAKIAVSS